MISVALVDDHALLRDGLANHINSFEGFKVLFEADNGKEFVSLLKTNPAPEIVLLDITMPEMDGFETAIWIKNNAPLSKVLVLSMSDDDKAIIRMLQNGARGYILKDSKPHVLKTALKDVAEKGYFLNDVVGDKISYFFNRGKEQKNEQLPALSDKEREFLKWCCTEKSYKEIADVMNISNRAVETLRSNLFVKLKTLSRVGLAMYTVRNGLIKV
jgi:DNA-binding NarL/FixJ family response regulator